MATASNLKKVALKKSFSAKSFTSEPEIGQNQQASNIQHKEGFSLRPTSHTTSQYQGAACQAIEDQKDKSQKMAQFEHQVQPASHAGNFNSISSIASEGLHQNFTSVQSIQTKTMMQQLGSQTSGCQLEQQPDELLDYQTAHFNFNTGNISLDRLLEQTLLQELAGSHNDSSVHDVRSQSEILTRVHEVITQQANLQPGEAMIILKQAAVQMNNFLSQQEASSCLNGKPEKLNKDLLFDFNDNANGASNSAKLKKKDKKPVSRKSASTANPSKPKKARASSKGKKKTQTTTPGLPKQHKRIKSISSSIGECVESIGDGHLLQQQDTINQVEPTELSIEPIKLQRLDLASVIQNQTTSQQHQLSQNVSKQSLTGAVARAASPQTDCMLSASVYNGDRPIQKPPKTKPVNLGSLNFDSLKSVESRTSRGSASFKLARLTLSDDTLNRSLERIVQRGSAEKKKFSPYKSKSRAGDSQERAIQIVNGASATSDSALKLRQYTKTQARPLSARSSTPIVPKPGAKQNQKDVNASQLSIRSNRSSKQGKPPTTSNQSANLYNKSSHQMPLKKPPQPTKPRKQPSAVTTAAQTRKPSQGATTTELNRSATMPHGNSLVAKRRRSTSGNNRSVSSRVPQGGGDQDHESYGLFHQNAGSLLKPIKDSNKTAIVSSEQQSQRGITSNSMTASSTAIGCSSHRLNVSDSHHSTVNLAFAMRAAGNASYEHEINASSNRTSHFFNNQAAVSKSSNSKSNLELQVEREASQKRRDSFKHSSNNSESQRSFQLQKQSSEAAFYSHHDLPLQYQDSNHVTFNVDRQPTSDFSRQERNSIKYHERKLLQKSMKQLLKVVQVQQQKSRLALMFHRSRLVAQVVQKWRSLKFINQEESQLARLRLSQILPIFQRVRETKAKKLAFREMKKLTLGEAAWDVYRLNLLRQCWHDGLVLYAAESLREKAVLRDIDELYQKKLIAKALACLSDYKKYSQKRAMLNDLAKQFYKEHGGLEAKRKAYDTLVSFAIYSKQEAGARTQHRLTLLFKAMAALRDYKEVRHKHEESLKLVKSFYKVTLATKAVKALQENTVRSIKTRESATEQLQARKVVRCFAKLKDYAEKEAQITPIEHGMQLTICQYWLKHSFAKVMQKVWEDYPKQELKKDPQSGADLPLKNYLSLSRHPRRGLPTFYRCNQNYRRYQKEQVLQALYQLTVTRKLRLRQFKLDRLRTLFESFRKVTSNYRLMKLFRQERIEKNASLTAQFVFEALRSTTNRERRLRNSFEVVRESWIRQEQKSRFGQWLSLSKKVRALNKCEEVSRGIDRHRTLTKYLALWFTRLHKKLKSKHMDKVKDQFYQRSAKTKFMRLWQAAYEENLELKKKDMTIVQMQERMILGKYLKVLSEYAISRREKSHKKRAAQQEYTYWLGKRAMTTLWRYFNHRRASKEMTEMVIADRASHIRQKVFNALHLYCRFLKERRMADFAVTEQIRNKQKLKALRSWTKLYSERIGARVLAQTLESAIKRFAFQQVQRVQILDDTNVDLFQEHAPTILLRESLLGWRRLARRRQYHKSVLCRFKEARMARDFGNWHKLYRVEQAKVDFFNKTVICIKNNITKRAFKSLALNFLKGRLKKRADVQRYTSLLSKVLKALRSRVYRRIRSIEQFHTLQMSTARNLLAHSLTHWFNRFAKKTALRRASLDARLYKMAKIFAQFKENRSYQKAKRENVLDLTQKFKEITARRSLLRFRAITSELAFTRVQSQEAREYHQDFLYRRSAEAWFAHFKKVHAIFRRFKRFRAEKSRHTKHLCLKQWTQNSSGALGRVRAAHNANQLLNKLQKRKYYSRWVSETNFLIRLEACQDAGTQLIRRMRVAKALVHMREVAQALVFDREKRFQTKHYADRKTMLGAFACLYKYKEDRGHSRLLKEEAFAACTHRRLRTAVASLCIFTMKQKRLREILSVLRKRQVELYAPLVLATWRQKLQQRIRVRSMTLTADGFDSERLSRKAFNCLLAKVCRARHTARLQDQADAFRGHKLIDRGLRALLLYLCHRREKQERAMNAFEVVGTLQEDQLARHAFSALVDNLKLVRHHSQLASLCYKRRLASSVLKRLLSHKTKSKALKTAMAVVKQKLRQRLQETTYLKWHETFVVHQALKAASQTHQVKMMTLCFKALVRQVELKKKLAMALQIRGVTATVKAFMSLKKHIFFSKVKRSVEIKAMLHRATVLKAKALKAFDICLTRKLLAQKVQQDSLLRLRQRAFTTWEEQLQLKLLRSNGLEVCRIVILRRALHDWRQSVEDAGKVERAETVHKVQLLAKAWNGFRLTIYRAKCHRYLFEKSRQSAERTILRQWAALVDPEQARGRAFLKRLTKVSHLQEHFDTIKEFSARDRSLTGKASPLTTRTQRRVLSETLMQMLKLTSVAQRFRNLDQNLVIALKAQAFSLLKEHAIEEIEEQDTLLETISFFANRRPQNLLMFQKVFLALSSQVKTNRGVSDGGKVKMCNASLAKYVFEKWRNVRPKLALSKQRHVEAEWHYRKTLVRSVWSAMATYSKNVRQKSCISMYVSQTHDDNLLKGVFTHLKEWAHVSKRRSLIIKSVALRRAIVTKTAILKSWRSFSAKRNQLRALGDSIAGQKQARLKFKYLAQMRESALKSHNDMSIVQAFDSRRLRQLAWTALYVLHDFAKCQRERRFRYGAVDTFRRQNLLKRGMLSLKLQHSQRMTKHRYSRLFAVFTAWKTVTKENNLLNKYLAECNYKQKSLMNQSHTIEQMGSSSKKNRRRDDQLLLEDDDGTFSAGQELVFTSAAGHLSFADSMIVDYHQPAVTYSRVPAHYQTGANQNMQQLSELQHSTIQHNAGGQSEQLGLTDLYDNDDGMSSRDNNFLFGCKPSAPNRRTLQRRFGGETSSDEDNR